ncbi:retrovirus-related pol polyprotein from transposon TNT 1-94, partial [Trifolium medium]|nr:retrovirus-related pol polyprotein from transposon TNT 1-94 [Trifolium medium]
MVESTPSSSTPSPEPKSSSVPGQTMSSTIHPALTVPNITNFIKVKLDMDKSQYNTWSELFKIHATVYQVIDHIIPSEGDATEPSLKQTDPKLWSRLDAVVLSWIYGTISDDLLNTIIERNSTAEAAWNRLFEIFFDNKHSRALYLEQEFSRVQMEQFPNASAYCQHLKSLSDQMSNVGTPVSNERLVLQLISGLTDAYATVGSQIRHGDTLPPFYKARSMIVLEETARAKKAAATITDNSAFLASQDVAVNNSSSYQNSQSSNNHGGRGSNNTPSNRGRSGNRNNRGGRGRGRNGGQSNQSQYYQYPQQQWVVPPWAASWQPWATPPCPYPTTPNWPHQSTSRQQGILGPRPQQAHMAAASANNAQPSYASTDIQAAMHTLSLAPPNDQWYMDTGATSHMTANG